LRIGYQKMITYLEGGPELLPQLEQISIAFEVRSIYEVQSLAGGLGGLALQEVQVTPYIKDYDAEPDGKPTAWSKQFDMRNWGVILARQHEQLIGGAVIAIDSPGVNMLAGRDDLAVLWDIRVAPDRRGQGLGRELFQHAAQWARQHGCIEMKIETQNINLPACRFYAQQGCKLGEIDTYGYYSVPEVRHESMLIWYFRL
jgi:streptothricin acetyltransferase